MHQQLEPTNRVLALVYEPLGLPALAAEARARRRHYGIVGK